MQFTSMNSISPSFTGNSSNNLADIAARVVEEFRNENGYEEDDDIYGNHVYDPAEDQHEPEPEPDGNCVRKLEENEGEEEAEFEFEFAVVCRNPNLSPVTADEIFSNGEILPRYPLFDRSLLLDDVVVVADKSDHDDSKPARNPLRKLFREERETATCSSSDILDGVTPGTYCIWKPKVESPERCKKSNSTGNTSKRWKFRNLLQRSSSDSHMATGTDAPVADFTPVTATKKKSEKVKKVDKTARVAGADDDGEPTPVTDESHSTNKGGNRLRSYLRYKRDQIGVSANVSR